MILNGDYLALQIHCDLQCAVGTIDISICCIIITVFICAPFSRVISPTYALVSLVFI